jgi:hypothetical protein
LARIHTDGTPLSVMDQLLPLGEFIDLIGLPEIKDLEERFADKKVRPLS